MFRRLLHDGWRLSATTGPVPAHLAGRTVPAQVPGSAHLDLLAAGLISHPSLALWNGANENMWGYRDWGWREELDDRTWGYGYYTELLPRFCAEFGFQAPPTWATPERWIHDEPLTPTSPAFLLHQKAEDGNGKLDRGFAPHLPPPATFADWHWTTQLTQARAVAFGIEHFRSWWPRTAGAIVWQLADCWPVTSWAAVDGDGRPKPLWYALRHAYAPRLLTIQPRDGRSVLIAVNDSDTAWTGTVRAERQSFDADVKDAAAIELDVAPRSVAHLDLPGSLPEPGDPEREVLVATSGAARAVHLFREDLELAYEPRPLTASATAVAGGYRVDVRATSFARDVAVLADRLAPDAETDEMLVTLLSGETCSFFVRTAARLDPAELTGPPVLRTANDLRSEAT